MLNVSDATKQIYLQDSVHKSYRVFFPELAMSSNTYTNENIVKESLSITESLTSGSSIEFVGCISSSLRIKLYNVQADVKGKKIEVYIQAGETEEIPIFKGKVDTVTIQAEHAFKEIIAYDMMYSTGLKDVASWYNNLSYPITLGDIRHSLEAILELNVDQGTTLINDNIVIPEKQYENVKALKAITILKSICQVNGVFGAIRRTDGYLEYRSLGSAYDPVILGDDFFLGDDTYLGADQIGRNGYFTFNFYKDAEYQEYEVKPVQRVQIRSSEEDSGVIVGPPTGNKYVIQGNIFTYGLEVSVLQTIGNNILGKIGNVSFHPCNIKTIGLPFLEPGDVISYPIRKMFVGEGSYNINTFIVLERTLSGDQVLNDQYVSEGDEFQKEFITDIQAQLNTLKTNVPNLGQDYYTADQVDDLIDDTKDFVDNNYYDMDEIDTDFAMLETPTGFNVASVYTLPNHIEQDTIYLIQGGVIML